MNMKKVNLDTWLQLLGMTGVLSGLVFVGLELQQSQRIAIAEQQQARAAASMSLLNSFIESGIDHQSVMWEENFDYDYSEAEIAFRNNHHSVWYVYENDFYQYTQRLMDESTWLAKLAGIERVYNMCSGREIYNRRAPIFSEEFRAIIESLPDKCR